MTKPIIGIIGGNGKMGTFFANFFKLNKVKVKVNISDKGSKLSNKDIANLSNIIIVTVPIDKTVGVIQEVLPHIKKGSAIMDLT